MNTECFNYFYVTWKSGFDCVSNAGGMRNNYIEKNLIPKGEACAQETPCFVSESYENERYHLLYYRSSLKFPARSGARPGVIYAHAIVHPADWPAGETRGIFERIYGCDIACELDSLLEQTMSVEKSEGRALLNPFHATFDCVTLGGRRESLFQKQPVALPLDKECSSGQRTRGNKTQVLREDAYTSHVVPVAAEKQDAPVQMHRRPPWQLAVPFLFGLSLLLGVFAFWHSLTTKAKLEGIMRENQGDTERNLQELNVAKEHLRQLDVRLAKLERSAELYASWQVDLRRELLEFHKSTTVATEQARTFDAVLRTLREDIQSIRIESAKSDQEIRALTEKLATLESICARLEQICESQVRQIEEVRKRIDAIEKNNEAPKEHQY